MSEIELLERAAYQSPIERRATIEHRFREFHQANPHIYENLVRMAKTWRERHPNRRLGIRMLWEAMRWDFAMRTDPLDEFKLNDNFPSRYARLIMQQEPDLDDVFELRKLRAP